jgi:hypothetical protein
MGRGLSPMQKQILGVAYTVNAHTQGGTAKVKAGAKLDGYMCLAVVVGEGATVDVKTSLLIWLIGGIETTGGNSWSTYFQETPEKNSVKASITRAVSRLLKRELLAYVPWRREFGHGYVLTDQGMAIAQQYAQPVPEIDTALGVFEISKRESGKAVWHRRSIANFELLANAVKRKKRKPLTVTDTQICVPVADSA